MVPPVRKEETRIVVCAAAHIIDGRRGDPSVLKLQPDQGSQIAVRLDVAARRDGASAGGTFHLGSDFVPDLESTDSNVRADRCDHLCGVVLHSLHGLTCDIRDRTPPSRMHCSHVAARRMRDQDRYAVGRPRGDAEPLFTRDERIAFEVHHVRGPVGARDLTDLVSVYLPLLEQVI